MLKLCRVTKVKVLFLVQVYVFNFNLFEFSAATLEKGLLATAEAMDPINDKIELQRSTSNEIRGFKLELCAIVAESISFETKTY